MHQEHGARGFSFQLEDAPPEAPDLGRLDLDWSDLATGSPPERELTPAAAPAGPAAPATAAPPSNRLAEPGPGTPLMPHAAAAGREGPASRPLLQAFAPISPPAAPETSAPRADQTASASASASPVVRRLRFPAATAASKPSPRPSTRFADSIGQSRLAPESASDATRGTDDGQVHANAAREDVAPEDVAPEDLPLRSERDATEPAVIRQAPTTPSALLLRQAGTLWASAKGTASELGGRGLESSRILATQMSDAVRQRLEQKLASRAEAQDAGPEFEADGPSARAPVARASSRGPRLAWVRAGAGPMLALVAALGMFIASRQLLGAGGPSLSRTTAAVPDLGEVGKVEAGQSTAAPATPSAGPAGNSGGPPPAMVTEVVPLPPGMAWPGKGLLEVVTSEDQLVYVDGVFTGRGPLRRVPVTPGAHEISIRKEGSERQGTAEVEPGRTTRALFRNEQGRN